MREFRRKKRGKFLGYCPAEKQEKQPRSLSIYRQGGPTFGEDFAIRHG